MSIEQKLVLARFEEYIRWLRTMVNANVERKVMLTKVIAKIRNLLASSLSINRSDYSVKIAELTKKIQRLLDLVESKDLD